MIAPREFRFLGISGELDEIRWDGSERDKLWRYNQHYFDDLNAEGADERGGWHKSLLKDWIDYNPPGNGSGWEPYPTSLRIVNWIKWALGGNEPSPEFLHSLAVQTRWLSKRVEHHLQGNHLFANAKALVFAGVFFDGAEAEAWRLQGKTILDLQIPEQILPDGGHFELSTMYHALAVEDMLDLANVLAMGESLPDLQSSIQQRVPSMLSWLVTMSHPDQGIAFFNDAAFGIAPDTTDLLSYARHLGFAQPGSPAPISWLKDSGYARLSAGPAILITDLAPIGPDYLPGHAHADTLSFELSLFGQRVVVNSGTSVYGTGTERVRQRGTAAHSTVVVDGADSSEVWSGFRVAQRAKPFDVKVESALDGNHTATGKHDGYSRLPKRPVHCRSWSLSDHRLTINDDVTPPTKAEARYILSPQATPKLVSPTEGSIILNGGRTIYWRSEAGPARIEETSWHPEFGSSLSTKCLVLPLKKGKACMTLDWS